MIDANMNPNAMVDGLANTLFSASVGVVLMRGASAIANALAGTIVSIRFAAVLGAMVGNKVHWLMSVPTQWPMQCATQWLAQRLAQWRDQFQCNDDCNGERNGVAIGNAYHEAMGAITSTLAIATVNAMVGISLWRGPSIFEMVWCGPPS